MLFVQKSNSFFDTAVSFLESGLHYFYYKLHKTFQFCAMYFSVFYLPQYILFRNCYFNDLMQSVHS